MNAALYLGTKLRQDDVGEWEKLCTKCNEWWPADLEFFFSDPKGVAGLFYCCKACYAEQWGAVREARRLAKLQAAKEESEPCSNAD